MPAGIPRRVQQKKVVMKINKKIIEQLTKLMYVDFEAVKLLDKEKVICTIGLRKSKKGSHLMKSAGFEHTRHVPNVKGLKPLFVYTGTVKREGEEKDRLALVAVVEFQKRKTTEIMLVDLSPFLPTDKIEVQSKPIRKVIPLTKIESYLEHSKKNFLTRRPPVKVQLIIRGFRRHPKLAVYGQHYTLTEFLLLTSYFHKLNKGTLLVVVDSVNPCYQKGLQKCGFKVRNIQDETGEGEPCSIVIGKISQCTRQNLNRGPEKFTSTLYIYPDKEFDSENAPSIHNIVKFFSKSPILVLNYDLQYKTDVYSSCLEQIFYKSTESAGAGKSGRPFRKLLLMQEF
eukprot:UN24720